jgi:hypothetical protein
MKILKKISVVGPRTVWRGEASEFTPWLAEPDNIALLGEAVELDLEYQAQEQAVGQFRANIVCKV